MVTTKENTCSAPGPRQTALLAGACGAAAANIYYNQPMLADIGRALGVSGGAIGLLPTATQVGFALGLLLLLLLGDRVERRWLILGMSALLCLFLLAAALAPSLIFLALASLLYLVFGALGCTILGLVAGVILLEVGVWAAQTAIQQRIFATLPEARDRVNAVYMVSYFVGGALGSALGSVAWSRGGSGAVSLAGGVLSCGALAAMVRGPRPVPAEAEARAEGA